METNVSINNNHVRITLNYFKGRCVTLSAVYIMPHEYGYNYDPLQIKRVDIIPMKRENKKKLNALCTVVLANKENIARLYTEDKFNDVKKLFNEETI